VERLENREQPGSLLSSGLGVSLLGTALDAGSLPADSPHLTSLVHRRLTTDPTPVAPTAAVLSAAPGATTRAPASPAPTPAPTNLPTSPTNIQVLPLPASPRLNQGIQAPTASALPAAVPVAAPTVVDSGSLVRAPDPQPTPTGTGSDGGITPQFVQNWATYLGTSGSDFYTKVKYTSGGLYVAGSVTDSNDSTAQDLAVAKLSLDGSTRLQYHTFNFGAGVKFFSRGLDVASDGTVYVGGFIGPNVKNIGGGLSNLEIVSVKPDFSATNWAYTFSDPTVRTAVYSVKLDSAGTNLYFDGDEDLSAQSLPADNLLAGKLTGLTGASPTVVYQHAYVFSDASMNPTATVVPVIAGFSGIAPDAAGNADIVANYNDNAGNIDPLFGQIAADGGSFHTSQVYSSVGMRGLGTDITVDSGNNYLFTGSVSDRVNTGTMDELVAKWSQANSQVYGSEWEFSNSSGGLINTFGFGIREDSSGAVYTISSTSDPSQPPTSNIQLEADKYSSNGQTFVDGTLGAVGGTSLDYGLGIDIGGVNNTAYIAGTTNSTDFSTTAGAYQQTYQGGAFDGYVASLTL
jgi:hypothetical protein